MERSRNRAHRLSARRPSSRSATTGPRGNEKLRADYKRMAEHAGKYKARVAVARKLLDARLLCTARRRGPMPRDRGLSLGHGPTRARLSPWSTAPGVAVVSD